MAEKNWRILCDKNENRSAYIWEKTYFPYLLCINKLFPVHDDIKHKQIDRITVSSLDSFKYRMYGLSDMFQFGHINDINLFWSAELDDRKTEDLLYHNDGITLKQFAKNRICEVYLVTEYLKNIGINWQWNLKSSWRAIANHFCIIDNDQLDLLWLKYSKREFFMEKI